MAVATVAAKLGFLDNEDAICSTKYCCCSEFVLMSSINLFKNVGSDALTNGTVISA
uniref:mRNA, 1346 bp sequence n=1 Tax=Solanum tuberosum TaxID=4113 RepID=M1ABK2_SOLTU